MSTEDFNPFARNEEPEPVGAIPIKKVRPRHNAIMDFILANPTVQMGAVAAHFGVTPSWLSIIINSDCFQSLLREKQEEMFREMIIPLNEKLTGVAHRAVEKLGEKIDESTDASFILDSTDKVLNRLGFGAKSPGAIQINTGAGSQVAVVNSDVLSAARQRMLSKVEQPAQQLPPLEHSAQKESPPIEGEVLGDEQIISHDDLWGEP